MDGSYPLNCGNIRLLPAIRSRPPFSLCEGRPGGAYERLTGLSPGMSEDKKPFTVSDRRHFTSEGEVRKSDADEPTSAPTLAAEKAVAPPPAAPAASAAGIQPPGAEPEPEPDAEDERGSRFPSDFLGLLISLGAQGSMLLMGGPEGETPDLDGARSLIELLGALKEKTEGRRTPQEDQLLDGLLYELRMAFVQATKAAGR